MAIHPIDKKLGKRIKEIRKLKGITLKQLALKIGTSYQKISCYEKGTSKISTSELFYISNTLGVDVNYFIDEI